ncbi:MAG: hypothetical protein L0332_02780 [Chloroflexi bacterium]|nr:hypothetical protein [Chloroflexota bacterium]MCI0645159.1 hypothetical protein [Chloroflexota bacterium]MCI0725639.1 hypothetical protein [Chloroflexota bacterium]
MKQRVLLLAGVVGAAAFFLFFLTTVTASTLPAPAEGRTSLVITGTVPADLYAGNAYGQPLVNVTNQSVFGPDACTAAGDPVSPGPGWNPWWSELEGTYHYRIVIPADYPYDVVRVELFDPDSTNQVTNTHTISHTWRWIRDGGPASEVATCDNPAQQDACLIPTCELTGQCSGVTSTLSVDVSNPLWFVRVDENRGTGTPGVCGRPTVYTPTYNTQTLFELFHYSDDGGGAVIEPLASYTGQSGDGVRDDGGHQTDLRWVAPGGPAAFDQPAAVPADCGSPTGGDYDPVSCPGGTPAGALKSACPNTCRTRW